MKRKISIEDARIVFKGLSNLCSSNVLKSFNGNESLNNKSGN
ncbi:MAG: hypothetical protein ABIY50_06210 [Ignavibacteria bacterium]